MKKFLRYREHAPPPHLRSHVQCVWQLDGTCDEFAPEVIVPDGCMSLVLNFEGGLQQLTDDGALVARPNTLLVGELRRAYSIGSTGHQVDLLGVRFWPGMTPAFLDANAGEVVDAISDDASLDARLRTALSRTVRSANPRDRLQQLHHALGEQLVRGTAPNERVRAAVQALFSSEGAEKIDSLANRLGVSRRQLERQFSDAVGIAPKALSGVLRFRRVVRALESASPDWASVALECGYSDQAHLIRDFKRYVGQSPAAFLKTDQLLAFPGS